MPRNGHDEHDGNGEARVEPSAQDLAIFEKRLAGHAAVCALR
jgi:hypothetical protein